MPRPQPLARLRLPLIAAPMFLVSGPALVTECCKSGIVGTFPALNQRTTEGLRDWLSEITETLNAHQGAAPYGVNLVINPKFNSRGEADLKTIVDAKVPLVITSLGAVREVVDAIHSYGGLVFHDVISKRHAEKAAEAGVDGLILVSAGAGGHAGTLNPFSFISEIRRFFDRTIILSGGISDGYGIAGAIAAGADFAYLGTRFIATDESMAPPEYKQMLTQSHASDIVYTAAISGVYANFLGQTLAARGIDPKSLPEHKGDLATEAKAWRDFWSAGHGVGSIPDILPVARLVDRLEEDYKKAVARLS